MTTEHSSRYFLFIAELETYLTKLKKLNKFPSVLYEQVSLVGWKINLMHFLEKMQSFLFKGPKNIITSMAVDRHMS